MTKGNEMRSSVYRLDRFVVPATARDEFLKNINRVHSVLREQRGFIWDAILENDAGPDEFNIVTIAEWENAEVMEPAKAAVMASHRQANCDPQELFRRLDIRMELGNYRYAA
jgi:heme-degrading monooxygenase HmoA